MRFFVIFVICSGVGLFADCECKCVNGTYRAICDNSFELKPLCDLKICPMDNNFEPKPQSLFVLNPPFMECYNAKVYNPKSARYEWERVCE